MPSFLTRSQFNEACQAFVSKHNDGGSSSPGNGVNGWCWKEHAYIPSMGFLTRTVMLHRTVCDMDSEDQEADEAATKPTATESLSCHQHVAYSASFQVPAFYFNIFASNGSPLPISDVLKTAFFRSSIREDTKATTFAVSAGDAAFPLLSQGDHPVLGTPSWYLHPCETANAVGEIMDEIQHNGDWNDEMRLVRWLETWFMVVGTAVDLE
ncbi:hypothetical protein EYR40_005368 [Pleurotus pulmonarius]|nr:hypothetical protein EYR40_005368 [Pleurotus pulmonarius]